MIDSVSHIQVPKADDRLQIDYTEEENNAREELVEVALKFCVFILSEGTGTKR